MIHLYSIANLLGGTLTAESIRLPWRGEDVAVDRLDVAMTFLPPPALTFCGIPGKRLVALPQIGITRVPMELAIAHAFAKVGLGPAWWSNWQNPHRGISTGSECVPYPPEVEERLAAIRSAAASLSHRCDERACDTGKTWRTGKGRRGGQWDVIAAGGPGGLLMAECKGKDRMRDMQRVWLEAALSNGHTLADFLLVFIRAERSHESDASFSVSY